MNDSQSESCSFFSNTQSIDSLVINRYPYKLMKWSDEDNHFFCIKCKSTPLIQIKDFKTIIFNCKCEKNPDCKTSSNINDLMKYIKSSKDLEQYLKCQDHEETFKYYCNKCNMNFCNICKDEKHGKKDFENFDKYKSNFKDIEYLINLFNLNEKEINLDSNDNDDYIVNKDINYQFKKLISTIINDYSRYPNSNLIKCIINIYNFLKNINIADMNNYDIKKEISVKSSRELERIKDNKEKLQLVTNLIIFQSDFNINDLIKYKLVNLISLNLKHNGINNIEILIKCKFPNLKFLNLEINKIDDKNIDYINNLNFPNLENLNLNQNYLSNYKLFKSIEHFHNLDKLDVGSNDFDENTYIKEYINLNSIKTLILTNGVFNNNSIEYIKFLKLENIEELNLEGNNLNSLSFIESVYWPNLKTLNLNYNNINEIKQLIKFKYLNRIKIIDNLIKEEDVQLTNLLDKNENLYIVI